MRRRGREDTSATRPVTRTRAWGARRLARALADIAFLGLLARLLVAPPWLEVAVLCTIAASLLLYGGALLAMRRHRPFALGRFPAFLLSLVGIALALWWVREATTFGYPPVWQRAAQGTAFALSFAMGALLSRASPKSGVLSRVVLLAALLVPLSVVGLLSFTPLGPTVWRTPDYVPIEVQFAPGGKALLVRAAEGPLFALDSRTGRAVARTYASSFSERREVLKESLQSFALLPEEAEMAVAALVSTGRLRTFRAELGGDLRADAREDLAFPQGEMLEIVARPDGARIILFESTEGAAVGLWDQRGLLVAGPHRLPGLSTKTAVSPDGTLLVYVSRDLADQGLAVVDLRSGSLRKIDLQAEFSRLGGTSEDYVAAVALSPDGKEAALGVSWHADPTPGLLWRVDVGSGKVVDRLAPGDAGRPVLALCYSPNGRFLAYTSSGERCGLVLHDLTRRIEARLPRSERCYGALTFSPDSRRLVALRGDEIALWRVPR